MTGSSGLDSAIDLRLRGEDATLVRRALDTARVNRWPERLHDRDASLWSGDARVQAAIRDYLGWLDAPQDFGRRIPALEGFGDGIRDAGFSQAVLMGMGGSSLAAETLSRTFGTSPGYLDVRILDSTHPAAVTVVDDLDPLATLWIVSSKSGRTTESLAFQAAAWARIEAALARRGGDDRPGLLMIAITDPGKSVEAIPHHEDLREVFLNPPDVGGRYSALSYPGLVPASLIGLDLDALLASAQAMLARSREPDPARNVAVGLGVAIGALARAGRDKLTLIIDPELAAFGPWLEQLLAESTGKHGTGIVPIEGEPLGDPSVYGPDRVFVRIRLAGSAGPPSAAGSLAAEELLARLEAAGHPVIALNVDDPIDIGAEFVRWEVATAIAGAVLGVDPFDQPNVEESKDRTRRLLAAAEADRPEGAPSPGAAQIAHGPLVLHPDAALRLTAGDGSFGGELSRHLERRHPGAYLAIQAYLAPNPATDAALTRLRERLRTATRCATTVGYGPRYLHSTGQLHKGGPPTGWFLQLTDDHEPDRDIPDWPYTFGQLLDAQASGDFAALEAHDLPVARIHLGRDVEAGLAALEDVFDEILRAAADPTPPGAGG